MNSLQNKSKRSLSIQDKAGNRYISVLESLIDNIIVLFFEPRKYLQSLRDYVSFQFRTRTKYFVIAILLLCLSFYLLFFFLVFFYLFLYQSFLLFIKEKIIVFFLLLWITLLIFWIAIYNSLNFFYKIGKKIDFHRRKK